MAGALARFYDAVALQHAPENPRLAFPVVNPRGIVDLGFAKARILRLDTVRREGANAKTPAIAGFCGEATSVVQYARAMKRRFAGAGVIRALFIRIDRANRFSIRLAPLRALVAHQHHRALLLGNARIPECVIFPVLARTDRKLDRRAFQVVVAAPLQQNRGARRFRKTLVRKGGQHPLARARADGLIFARASIVRLFALVQDLRRNRKNKRAGGKTGYKTGHKTSRA